MNTFPYQYFESPPTHADTANHHFRPMLLVTIFGYKASFPTIALVDTGAVETLIPLDYWDEIEPIFRDDEEGHLEVGDGRKIETKYGSIDIATKIGDVIYRWGVKVAFSNARDEMVLGDWGFLRYFSVNFDRHIKRMTVQDPTELPPSFINMIPTGDLPSSYSDVRNQMSAHKRRRPKPRRRPSSRTES